MRFRYVLFTYYFSSLQSDPMRYSYHHSTIGEWKNEEVKEYAPSHTAREKYSWDLSPSPLSPVFTFHCQFLKAIVILSPSPNLTDSIKVKCNSAFFRKHFLRALGSPVTLPLICCTLTRASYLMCHADLPMWGLWSDCEPPEVRGQMHYYFCICYDTLHSIRFMVHHAPQKPVHRWVLW